ncbi:hypothetical protein Ade02nite_04840 [Paractinoplanes deccanensis]|uniref:Response regulatory domain-containing protein n=1 Tax=Paractinoplanes deccanensis TaxID=113561 RepID=A0ABQ3XVU1_9ACTN|nr:response regulator [Actinoplanes deccanensis]GID71843.1 hypothetical protein Ade02nite_04840 [Actinoplanes deccanensis]
MDTTLAVFIIAVLVIALAAVLLLRSQNRDGHATASLSFTELFSASITLGPQNTESARQAVRQAALEQGKEEPPPDADVAPTRTTLARVLWVDDNPDNNLYETVALERCGRLVTKATSTSAALHYLEELDFAAIVTDLGRAGDPDAGVTLLRKIRADLPALPIIVYTMNAGNRRAELLGLGADAVVDQPYELIREVNGRLAEG